MAATENIQIRIDPDVLRACGNDLERIAAGVKTAAGQIDAHPLSGRAFGLMNAWMVPPITGLASQSADAVRLTGDIAAATGAATLAAVQDFENAEQTIIQAIDAIDAAVLGG